MKRRGPFLVCLLLYGILAFCANQVQAETYSSTETFDPGEGIFWNFGWEQCLPTLPPGSVVDSAEIELRAKVYAWGFYPIYLLCSDTTSFSSDPSYSVCDLTLSTHPSPSNFYTIKCTLKQNQIEWLANNNCAHFMTVANGATYYLDYATVTVETTSKVATPVFSPAPGLYDSDQNVTITCSTAGAVVTYTTDGSEPTIASTPYTSPIQTSGITTLRARAFKTGWLPSDIAIGDYIIEDGNETTLHLRDNGILSEEMGDPVPLFTQYLLPQGESSSYEWQTALTGDITDTFYHNIDVVESEETAQIKVEFIVDQDGSLTTVASNIINVAAIPQGYYQPHSAYLSDVDMQTKDGDILILRISHISGSKRVGIGLDGTQAHDDSHIRVYYNGPVACFSVTPQEGDLNTVFGFDASCSFDKNYSTSQLEIRWDWDSDGNYDTTYTSTKTATRQFSSSGVKYVKLQAKNPDGLTRSEVQAVPISMVELGSFSSPGEAPNGLTWDGTNLWLSDSATNTIYKLSTSGEVITSFPSPCGDPLDLAWDGEFLWVVDAWGTDNVGNKIFKLDTSGTVITSFDVPADISTGLTWDGHFLWAADGTNSRIVKLDPSTGEVVVSFASPGPDPRGLAWDGQYLWNADFSTRLIYQLDVNGNVIKTYPAPGTGPMGLTWDGSNLWCVDLDSYKIFKLTDRIPTTISCEPSRSNITLGEILTISGQISPPSGEAGEGVSIELISPAGDTIYRATLANINGEFDYTVICSDIVRAGIWTLRTRWSGSGPYEGAVSPDVPLLVSKAESRVTVDAGSRAVKLGDLVDISGKLTPDPDCGRDLTGLLEVQLVISGPGGSSDTQTVTTSDPFGHFVLQDYDGFNALGEWSLQAVFLGDEAYEESSSDPITVQVVETAGYGVIVQGRIENEEGIASHNKTANFVYEQLKQRGLLDEDIYYLNYDTDQDGVDGAPSKVAVEQAITVWAMDKMNVKPANLYLVFMDHGLSNEFYLYPDVITATDLGTWLDTLLAGLDEEAAMQEMVVLLGFCRSGSFLDELGGENRVVITSAAANESSYKGPLDPEDSSGVRDGEFFITEFFKAASVGKDVLSCFRDAVEKTELFTSMGTGEANAPYSDDSRQHPLLDDTGDGVGENSPSGDPGQDGYLSRELLIGVSSVTGNAPGDVQVTQVSESQHLGTADDTSPFWARVDDNTRMRSLWLEIKPPGYEPGPGTTEQIEMELPGHSYDVYNDQLDSYEWSSVSGFSDPGTYQVFFFARDDLTGNESSLKQAIVYKAKDGNSPPGSFSLLSPVDFSETRTVLVLDWVDSTDPDGDPLTYTVEISEDVSFATVAHRAERLGRSHYFIGDEAGLKDLATYYWRVTAVDFYGASTVSTEVWSFSTNNTNPLAGWIVGRVYDTTTEDPISSATVSVGGQQVSVLSSGDFIGLVEAGTYTVAASAAGFNPKSYPGVVIRDAEMKTKDFALVPTAAVVQGDIDGDLDVDLADAILALQVMAGNQPSATIYLEADVNGDNRIGLEEAIYIMQRVAGFR